MPTREWRFEQRGRPVVRNATTLFLTLYLAGGFSSLQAADPASVSSAAAGQYCATPNNAGASLADRRQVSARQYGAKGDGTTDDTAALQRALNQTPPGAVLNLGGASYVYSSTLTVAVPGVIILGNKATLIAQNPQEQAIVLQGDRTGMVGLTVRGAGKTRLTSAESAQVELTGGWIQVVGNDISSGASAGILVYGAHDFRVVGNRVRATLADGIHMTHGAQRGIVEGNTVRGSGDDMISVVSYCPHAPKGLGVGLTGHILIHNNDVSDNTWGRGIAVTGGDVVAITDNRVSGITYAGGIVVSQEASYATCGVRAVAIERNIVERIEVGPLADGRDYAGHGAIDLNSSNQRPVGYVDIRNNKISDVGFAGIRIVDEVCHVRLRDNDIHATGQSSDTPLDLETDGKCASANSRCDASLGNQDGLHQGRQARCAESGEAAKPWPAFDLVEPQGPFWRSCARTEALAR